MNQKKLFFVILLLNLFTVCAFAQTPDKKCVCPTVSIAEHSSIPQPNEPITFIANVSGVGDDEIIYNWSVDNGTIIEGQGTPVITVDKTGIVDSSVRATVEIKGDWCQVCENTTASATEPIFDPPSITEIGQLRRPNCEEILAQLDAFYVALQNNPDNTGYIISYGSSRAIRNVEGIIKNNIRLRRYDSSRLVFLQGGGTDKKATLEFYLVPPGAEPPTPGEPPAAPPGEEDIYENLSSETKPFIFSSLYYNMVCPDSLDINGFADALIENPKSRGNIVIYETTQKLFREKEKEILDGLTENSIERRRLKTFFKKIKPMSIQEGVELWFLP